MITYSWREWVLVAAAVAGLMGCATKPEVGDKAGLLLGSGGGSSSAATTDAASSSSGYLQDCTEVTALAFARLPSERAVAVYRSTTLPNLDTAEADFLQIEFYGPDSFPALDLDGDATGTFDLGAGIDSNYETCARCLLVYEAPLYGVRQFFQQSGTLVVDATSDQLSGTIHATVTDLILVEVTIDPKTFTSTPVPNGACLHVGSADIEVTSP